MSKAIFGKTPGGKRLERVQRSPNYRDGQFQNLSETPTLADGYHMLGVIYTQLFRRARDKTPAGSIPSVKTDLHHLPQDANVLVWFGHSSYFIQLHGRRFLVDPVLSDNASPIPGSVKAFKGSDIYSVRDLPEIDYLLITHDHYDHLDYETIIALRSKVGKVICGLGVGAHFEYWGYEGGRVHELDWYEGITPESGLSVHATPARHFSGRTLKRNNTLWLSYMLESSDKKIYLGGDSGYDRHFADIGDRFGPFDLAILDNGQYNEAWRYIHMLPEETMKAARDLKAKRLMPVHNSKFALGNHPWYEPLTKITELNKDYHLALATPMIGEVMDLDNIHQPFKQWWQE